MVSIYNQSQNIWEQLMFLCEIAHYRKILIANFGNLTASINKIFILATKLATRLSFYEVETLV